VPYPIPRNVTPSGKWWGRNDKVSDGSQPPMAFDCSCELNGWLPFAAPFCWLRVWLCEAPQIPSDLSVWAHPKAKLRNADIA
jgi:hypothetical protein